MGAESIDLIDRRDVTAALLLRPLDWRVRAVEQLVIESATSCRRARSLQSAPLAPVLGSVVDLAEAERAWVALNVAPMPRGPLFDFNIEGPFGQASLLPRPEIASREAVFIGELADAAGVSPAPMVSSLLSVALGFTADDWSVKSEADLARYLNDGIGDDLPDEFVTAWYRLGKDTSGVLSHRSDFPDEVTAIFSPALAVPELLSAGILSSLEEADEVLVDYRDWLLKLESSADAHGEGSIAGDVLNSLADYAGSYDLIVALEVPLTLPFVVKYSERRSLRVATWGNGASQSLVIADAQTNHVSVQIEDPNVRLRDVHAVNSEYDEAYGTFTTRQSQQIHAFYAHGLDRDYRVDLQFRLSLLPRLLVVPYVVAATLVALAFGLGFSAVNKLSDATLVVGPAGLAASILLTREPSTLGTRLRLVSSGVVLLSYIGLVVVAGVKYWLDYKR